MNQQNEQDGTEKMIEMTDLEAVDAEAIKGGPKKIFIGSLSATDEDLPEAQTREHILLARQVGL